MSQQEEQIIRDLKLLINGLVMLENDSVKNRILVSMLNLIVQQLINLDINIQSLETDYLQTKDFLSEDVADVDNRGFKYEKRIEALEKEVRELKLVLKALIEKQA